MSRLTVDILAGSHSAVLLSKTTAN